MTLFTLLLWIVGASSITVTMTDVRPFPDSEGPVFTHEPPMRVDFANSTGMRIDCSARGFPPPTVKWIRPDGSPVNDVVGLRRSLANGSLVFLPFRAEDYKAEIHSVTYVCQASNPSGVISSREVQVRAVVLQMYEVQVYDEYVIRGNTAVMKCHVPSFVKDYVLVTSWIKESDYGVTTPVENGGRYLIMTSGELHILRADTEDGAKNYRCQTMHKLTGEIRLSSTNPSGRLFVTDPRGSVTPRITSSRSSVHAIQGETIFLPCAAQGHPTPSYSWFAKVSEMEMIPISTSERSHQIVGTLALSNVQTQDAGTYMCEVSNIMGSVRVETVLTVTAPLSAYIYPQRQIVDLGQTASLTCVVSGYPISQITWLKDGKPLLTDTVNNVNQEVLRIETVAKADRGMYQCFVSNMHQVAEGTAELRLGDSPPEFQRIFSEKTLHPGTSLSLDCIVSGNPAPEVTWSLNGQKLPDSNRVSYTHFVDVNGDVITAVKISRVKVEDGGEYTCSASNHMGDIEHRANIRIHGPPLVRLKSQVTVVAGTELVIRCYVTGHPIEAVFWERDQRVLPVNHRQRVFPNGTLLVQDVQRSADSGKYTCGARDSRGITDRRDVEVIVMAPPKILPFSFQDDHLREGLRARIQCVLSDGDLPIAITWLKDGRAIPPSLGISVRDLDEFSSMLTVGSVSSRHNGNYTCVASNKAAHVNYTTELSVNVPPKIIPFSFQDAHLQEGMRVQITCAVSQGDPPIRLEWVKDGRPLPPALQVVVRKFDEFASSLSIESVSSRHGGNYTCTATNPAAHVHHSALLLVNVPPRWVTRPKDSQVLLGGTILVPCRADGFPKPVITWMKAAGGSSGEYREITFGASHISLLEDGSLRVTKAKESDNGSYLCKANNGVGAGLSEVIHLSVHVPPHFEMKRRNITAVVGEDAVLTCEVFGDKPLTVKWSFGKQSSNVNMDHRYKVSESLKERGLTSQLVIERVERQHSGVYPCLAKNAFGNEEASVHLIVQEPPEAVNHVRVVEALSRRVQFTWLPPYNGNSPITLYIIQYKDASKTWLEDGRNVTLFGQATSHTLDRLQPAMRYHVRLFAKNEIGLSKASKEIEVLTAMEAPGGPPQALRVTVVDSTTLHVVWKPPMKELWNGKISGYKIGFRQNDADKKEFLYREVTLQETDDVTKEVLFPLTNLRKYTKYTIIVHAFNHLGAGPASEEVVVRTAEDVPSKSPENIRCAPLSSQGLSLSWDPPPLPYINGQLLGYKVLYKPVSDWFDGSSPSTETKIVHTAKTTLHGLEKFRNYSVHVLAYTRAGDGAASGSIHCQTKEDVPEAPADIKAVVKSVESIVVAWRPPATANGVIIKYNVYMRSFDTGKEETNKYIVTSNNTLTYEARNLKMNRRYEFWVTASTTVGEGQSTKPVSQTPSLRVPPRILAFDSNLVSRWKENVSFGCDSVGIPTPDIEWTFRDSPVQRSEKYHILSNGNLQIIHVLSGDAGHYTCRVQNAHGTDAVAYTLVIQAPPFPPNIVVTSSSFTAIEVQWTAPNDGGSPIEGFTLYFKRDFGDWEMKQLPSQHEMYVLDNLWCGTRYMLYLIAINKIGHSDPSDIKNVRTQGAAPEIPQKSKLIIENSTSITLNLDSWKNGGCPILYFVIEYKLRSQTDWTLVSNNAKIQQGKYIILDLQSGTKYNLRITAHNSAGSTVAEYDFFTLHPGVGGEGSDEVQKDDGRTSFFRDVNITFPFAALMLFSVLVVVAIYCMRRHRNHLGHSQIDTSTIQPTQYEARYIATGEKKPTIVQSDFDKGSFTCLLVNVDGASDSSVTNTPRNAKRDPREEIQPYATYQLPGCKTEGFTAEDWNRYEIYNPGHQTLRTVGSGNVYPQLKKEGECTHGPDSSLSDDQALQMHEPFLNHHPLVYAEYASPVRSSDTSDSTSGTNQNTEIDGGVQLPCPPPKPRKPGRRAKVPDLIYRRHGEKKPRPAAPELHPFPEMGETSCGMNHGHLIKIPRPQLERPSAPTEATIETTFSFLDKMGSSQESSDNQKKSEDNGRQTSSNSSNSKDSST